MIDSHVQRRRALQWIAIGAAVMAGAGLSTTGLAAKTDAVLPPIGGGGGGQFVARCSPGKYLAGFEAWVADDVDAIRPLCISANGMRATGAPEPYPLKYGGDGGTFTRQLTCPADAPVVAGMYVQYEGVTTVVNRIHLFCDRPAGGQSPGALPSAVFDGPAASKTSAYQGFGERTQRCPPGLVGVGINGRSGRWLDAVGLICGAPAPPVNAARHDAQGFGTTRMVQPPAFLYGVDMTGHLTWTRHEGVQQGALLGQAPRPVGRGWGETTAIFPGGGNVIYAVTAEGTLRWFTHNGFQNGDGLDKPDSWTGGKDVGRGWKGFVDIVSGGEGVIYVVEPDGTLRWQRHLAFRTGQGLETPGSWSAPQPVGRGWSDYKIVFGGGNGILYVIANDGTLKWFRHNGYLTGAGLDTPGSWEGPKPVGRGWGDVTQAFSPGGGVIYALMSDGTLRWFKHVGYLDGRGLDSPGAWEGPKEVGRGWGELKNLFALIPRTPDVVR